MAKVYKVYNTGGTITYCGTLPSTRTRSIAFKGGKKGEPGVTEVREGELDLLDEFSFSGNKGKAPGWGVSFLQSERLRIEEPDGRYRAIPQTSKERMKREVEKGRKRRQRGLLEQRYAGVKEVTDVSSGGRS